VVSTLPAPPIIPPSAFDQAPADPRYPEALAAAALLICSACCLPAVGRCSRLFLRCCLPELPKLAGRGKPSLRAPHERLVIRHVGVEGPLIVLLVAGVRQALAILLKRHARVSRHEVAGGRRVLIDRIGALLQLKLVAGSVSRFLERGSLKALFQQIGQVVGGSRARAW